MINDRWNSPVDYVCALLAEQCGDVAIDVRVESETVDSATLVFDIYFRKIDRTVLLPYLASLNFPDYDRKQLKIVASFLFLRLVHQFEVIDRSVLGGQNSRHFRP